MNYNTNIEKISRESAGIASQKYNSLIDFTLLLDDADPNKGIVIPLNSLQKITMDENIFSMLPTAKILLLDSGKFFDLYPLNIGRKIFINIYLKNKNDQNKKEPYITTRMTIQDVAISPDITSSQIAYSINCIYDCQSLFNSIMPYPYKDFININIKESSVDVLRNIIQKIGMTFESDIETNDSQYWINGTLNNKNFIDHIINHSFIKKEDATLMFTDINGKCKYSSIKTLCNQPEKNSYIHTKKYNDLLKTASSEELNKKYPNTAIAIPIVTNIFCQNSVIFLRILELTTALSTLNVVSIVPITAVLHNIERPIAKLILKPIKNDALKQNTVIAKVLYRYLNILKFPK